MATLNVLWQNAIRKRPIIPYQWRHPIRHASLPTRNNLNLEGRVALVTGGTNGIGYSIAQRLAENGASVVVSSRKQSNVDKASAELRSKGLKVTGVACHIGNHEDRQNLISKVVSKYGDINIVVQNAGVNPHHFGIMDTPESAIDKACDTHIKANFRFVQQLYPYMKKSEKPCSIILTSSVAAYLSHMYPGIYAITKAGVNTMTRAFAVELSKYNIRINCITMGPIETAFLEPVVKVKEIQSMILQNLIIKRLGKPDDCAGLAAYLASDDSAYITAENFTISGGVYLRP